MTNVATRALCPPLASSAQSRFEAKRWFSAASEAEEAEKTEKAEEDVQQESEEEGNGVADASEELEALRAEVKEANEKMLRCADGKHCTIEETLNRRTYAIQKFAKNLWM